MNAQKGMLVSVLRGQYSATNNGVSDRYDTFVLVGEGIPPLFDATPDRPALYLVKRNLFGKTYMHVQPSLTGHYMAGGNFIHSSDGRFPNDYPVAIHDRQESKEEYDALSI